MEIEFVNAIQARDATEIVRLIKSSEVSSDDQRRIQEAVDKLSAFTTMGGASLLHWAADLHSAQLAKLVLSKGLFADVNSKDDSGSTALHWACGDGSKDVAELLLQSNANAYAVDIGGETPLHWAALNGHADCIELILDKAAANVNLNVLINKQADNGFTPLHSATVNQHGSCISVLLNRGANGEIKDKSGKSPRDIAEEKKLTSILDFFNVDKRTNFERISQMESEILKLRAALQKANDEHQQTKDEHEVTSRKLMNLYKEQMEKDGKYKELVDESARLREEVAAEKTRRLNADNELKAVLEEYKEVCMTNVQLESEIAQLKAASDLSDPESSHNIAAAHAPVTNHVDLAAFLAVKSSLSSLQTLLNSTLKAVGETNSKIDDLKEIQM
eukprot:TRINITY_DN3098_c1_g1_i1.p1 TRINITY_DN3098_c1_g1~~TRINITY_DN3098_c1_g1_i1.p1  ORF type:complete len:389 (+),score=93.40 TRINITY_DN3098_c1_g1_i1:76-1242(+)